MNNNNFSGLYVGKVINNNDTTTDEQKGYLGKIQVRVDNIHGSIKDEDLPWADPCFCYGSNDRGFINIPEVGSYVTVLFINGSPYHPVWLGVVYREENNVKVPISAVPNYPNRKVWQTGTGCIIMDDTDNTMDIMHKNGSMIHISNDGSITMQNTKGSGFVIDNLSGSIKMTHNGNYVTVEKEGVSMTDVLGQVVDINATGILIKSIGMINIQSVGAVNIASGGLITLNSKAFKTLAVVPPVNPVGVASATSNTVNSITGVAGGIGGTSSGGAGSSNDTVNSSNTYSGKISSKGTNWFAKSGVSFEGVQQKTLDGLQDLANHMKEKYGVDLRVTSCTDGSVHNNGTYSHYNGWKLDVANDAFNDPAVRAEFISYAESKGIKVIDEYSNGTAKSTGGHLDLSFANYKDDTNFVGFA